MATALIPYTLPVSKMISTMTTLLTEVRFTDSLAPSDIVNALVDSCRIGNVDYGKGIVNTFKLDVQPVKDLSETSSAFTITKAQVAQEVLPIDEYKFVPLSVSELLSRDAVLDGSMLDNFFGFVMSLLDDTTQFYLYDKVNAMYQNWTPTRATQTIEVSQIATTGLTGTELNAALVWNATELAKVMRKTMNNMKIKNKKYTDVEKYTNTNTNEETDVITALKPENFKFVVNDKYWTDFLGSAMASLYHSEKIGEMVPAKNLVLIPEDSMETKNAKTIGWLHDKVKFAIADFYKIVMSIVDPSTTYTNYFEHFALGSGVFKYAAGVRFVEKTIEPAAAGDV